MSEEVELVGGEEGNVNKNVESLNESKIFITECLKNEMLTTDYNLYFVFF